MYNTNVFYYLRTFFLFISDLHKLAFLECFKMVFKKYSTLEYIMYFDITTDVYVMQFFVLL